MRAHGSAARLSERAMMARAVTGMFNAAFADDHDALGVALQSFPELLVVRQNRPGQRATLAHAAAAGGAVGVAPQLFVAMHAAALREGRAGMAAELAAEEKAGAEKAQELAKEKDAAEIVEATNPLQREIDAPHHPLLSNRRSRRALAKNHCFSSFPASHDTGHKALCPVSSVH